MADTDSISSRMQKLAKLKRLKAGLENAPKAAPEQESVFAMPGPVAGDAAEPAVAADLSAGDEPSFAPELGGAADSDETPPTPAQPEEESAPAAKPAAQVEDRDDDSLSSYFAALGIPAEDDSAGTGEPAAGDTGEDSGDFGDDDFLLDTLEDETGDAIEMPDFSTAEVDPETLAREFENEEPAPRRAAAPEDAEGLVTVSFDESRSTLLAHVSRQMNCTPDDVVVTALDWYLDALFGEDEAKAS